MKLGIIGLGRMGGNIARRLMNSGHECAVFDISEAAREALGQAGAKPASGTANLLELLGDGPRAVWVMLPAGKITENAVTELSGLMREGDIIIDGGNTYYKDDMRRSRELAAKGIDYIDVGTSGGVWGLERGYCMMIGGPKKAVDHLDPIFATLAPGRGDIPVTPNREGSDSRVERGYIHTGPAGSGHFVKMVHNGIEYGIMQAYAEGFDLMRSKKWGETAGADFTLSMPDIAEVWRRGSVVSSWLLDLAAAALARDPQLEAFSGFVEDSGEGRWTVEAAIEEAVPAEVLTAALFTRFRSRQDHNFAEKMLSAMRKGFGGHQEGKGPSGPSRVSVEPPAA